jgi:glutamate-1-semialdehyde 2,1-aminomutase
MGKSQQLYERAKQLIPGGTQLLSKRPEMHLPGLWPSYYSKASGCKVWDLDDKEYYDLSYMGIGSCILGYADPDVDNAVIQAIKKGVMNTLNAPEEVELAEVLLKIHPWADMVRYTRTGGEAMTVAVRIARSYSGKGKVLFCGYHGWHDWYLSSNLVQRDALQGHLLSGLSPTGIPDGLRGVSFPFMYNDTQQFLKLIETHKNQVGAIVLESVRNFDPTPEFLQTIREVCTRENIPLVVDEISAGFRNTVGGAHLAINLEPDLAVFAKAISNGYAMAAIIGKKNMMQAAQQSFISSTYWTERTGPAAALATIDKFIKTNTPAHLSKIGSIIKAGWKSNAEKHQLKIKVYGLPVLCGFSFDYPNPLELKTLFTQEMLAKGFLASTAYYGSLAHTEGIANQYLQAVDQTFAFIAQKIKDNKVKESLHGEVCHSGFQRLA